MMDNRGLYSKYIVKRCDGQDLPGQKHHKCDHFVIDLNHDECAGVALLAYADACEATRPELAKDLRNLVSK